MIGRSLFATILARPVTILMVFISLLVVGFLANQRLPRQLFPSGFVAESISVSIPVLDSTPQEVMERVAIPAEELIRTIPGITRIQSTSGSSVCRLRITYAKTEDADLIYADIRDRMERLLPTLPEGSDRYRIFRFNIETDLPVMSCAATFTDAVVGPDLLLENVVAPRLEAVDGVARVEVRGLIGRQVAIELIPERIAAHSVDVAGLIARLRGENILAPGGAIEDGGTRSLLRVSQRFETLDEVRAFRVDDSLLLGDLAEVFIERGVEQFVVRVDGELCKVLRIFKDSDANAVEVCRRLNEVYEKELPRDPRFRGFEFHVFFDTGEMITESIGSLQSTCAWGGVLALVILFVFLRRVRATLLVSAAIPLSLLIAIVVIFFSGATLNVFSMTGLTIAIGMLIDNAIVVSENIFRWRERGLGPRAAAAKGVSEVALAVTLATLTTVAVFVPLIFLGSESNIRVVMGEVGLPVCYSLIASLFVALVFIPTGSAQLPAGSATRRGADATRPPGLAQRIYRRALIVGLRHRLPMLCLLGLALLTLFVPLSALKTEGEKGSPSGDHYVEVEFPRGIGLAEADRTMDKIREAVEPLREPLHIETIAAWFGSEGGTLALFLIPGQSEQREVFLAEIKPALPDLPGVRYSFGGGGDERATFRIDAIGRDPTLLTPILSELATRLRDIPGVLEVTTPADETREEIAVVVERERAQRFAVSTDQVSSMVGWMLRGAPLPDFELEGQELPMWIRFQEQETEGLGELERVEIFAPDGRSVPLSHLARFEVGRSLPSIRRSDRQVSSRIVVTFESGTDLEVTEPLIREEMRASDLPEGYAFGSTGGLDQFQDDLQDVMVAGALGIVLIFFIMGILFESMLLPLSILCSVPFLFVGAFWSCFIFDETLTGTALIGFVILLGIVVNNAIVLVDCINRFRREGMLRSTAVLAAAHERLRPIWMTALTTVCGLLPLVVFPHDGGGVNYRPLGVVVLGGLSSATIFTLLAVPLFYVIFDDLRAWWGTTMRWGLRSEERIETPTKWTS